MKFKGKHERTSWFGDAKKVGFSGAVRLLEQWLTNRGPEASHSKASALGDLGSP